MVSNFQLFSSAKKAEDDLWKIDFSWVDFFFGGKINLLKLGESNIVVKRELN